MLAFLDESHQVQTDGSIWTALAGICMLQEVSRDVARELFNLKKRFWKVRSPDEIELKGSNLLSSRGILSPRNRDFVQEIISLCKLYKLVPFAVAQCHEEGLELNRLKLEGVLPDLHRGVLRRINRLLSDKHSDKVAVLCFDERSRQDDRHISRAFRNYLFKSKEGQEMGRIVETPFFYDSQVTPAGEIADIVAYVMCARYGGRKNDVALEEFFTSFRSLTYNPEAEGWTTKRLWGFSALGVDRE